VQALQKPQRKARLRELLKHVPIPRGVYLPSDPSARVISIVANTASPMQVRTPAGSYVWRCRDVAASL